MIVLILSIILLISSAVSATNSDSTFLISDYKTIAVAPPQIAQIFTNPNLSQMKDVKLSSENQIKLFEEFGDSLCQKLADLSEDKISLLCYDDIKSILNDTKSRDNFNKLFSGRNRVNNKVSRLFAEKLNADGVITSSLMFSYYEQSETSAKLEVYYEWDLINMISGKSDTCGSYSYGAGISTGSSTVIEDEYSCFEKLSDRFMLYFEDLFKPLEEELKR